MGSLWSPQDPDGCACGCAGEGRGMAAVSPPGLNKNPPAASQCPPGAAVLPCTQGFMEAGKNWPLCWMARNLGDGAGEEGCAPQDCL